MAIVQLEKVNKAFGQRKILQDFSLEIEAGEMVCLWGASGSGKTTLLNIIGTLDGFDSGRLVVDGVENPGSNYKKGMLLRRNTIGYIFQNFALVDNETVDENLNLALAYNHEIKDKEKAKNLALQKMGVEAAKYRKVYELSGGEQQRVALARVFLKPCRLILADEPTGSLDEENKAIVMGHLQALNQMGKTIIIVTHDKGVAASCGKIVRL